MLNQYTDHGRSPTSRTFLALLSINTLTQNIQTEGLQATLKSTSYHSKVHDVIEVTGPAGEKLKVSFQRTIRVPDYDGDSELPPGMGAFPLYNVADYKGTLHNAMSVKGGFYFLMYCEYLFF